MASEARGADDGRLQLGWSAPPECPHVEQVRARIRELTGDADTGGVSIEAEATIARKPNGRFHLTLLVRSGASMGRREIDANTCADLAATTAVNLSLLLQSASPLTAADADRSRAAATDATSDEKTLASAPTEAKVSPSNATRSDRDQIRTPLGVPSRRWRGLLGLPLIATRMGLLPSASWGAALFAGVQLERWAILVDGNAWLRQSISTVNASDVSAQLDHVELGLRLCHRLVSLGAIELMPCAALSLQHIWTRGAGTHIAARSAEATWLSPGIAGRAHWWLSRWIGLVVGIDAAVQTARPKLVVDGLGRIGQTGPVAITFLLGTEWIL